MTENDITLRGVESRGGVYGFNGEPLPDELLDASLSNAAAAQSALVLRSSDGSVKVKLYLSAKPDLSDDKLIGGKELVPNFDGTWREVPKSSRAGCLPLLLVAVLGATAGIALVAGV